MVRQVTAKPSSKTNSILVGTPAGAGNDQDRAAAFGVVCIIAFSWVIMSHKLAIGEVSAVLAFLAALRNPRGFKILPFYRWYLVYVFAAALSYPFSDHKDLVQEQLIVLTSIVVVALSTMNLVTSNRTQRWLAIGYLAIYALYPVRGAWYNFLHGVTEQGRIAWNFFFSNPNDLSMACFLPMGLCGYLIFTESKWIRRVAVVGLLVLFGTQLLTQSRGALIGCGIGVFYYLLRTNQKLRTVLVIGVLGVVAASIAPDDVWKRMGGLKNASVTDMSQVDPEGSASGRWTVMGVALGIALDHPVFGVGVGAYPFEHAVATRGRSELRPDERGQRDAHSAYLRAAAETGFIGAIAFVMFLLSAIRLCGRVRRALHAQPELVKYSFAILSMEASMIAYCVGAVFNSAERSTYTMFQFVIPSTLACYLASTHLRQQPVSSTRRNA